MSRCHADVWKMIRENPSSLQAMVIRGSEKKICHFADERFKSNGDLKIHTFQSLTLLPPKKANNSLRKMGSLED